MPQLPLLSGREVVKALHVLGYEIVRQRGSHMRLHATGRKPLTVPDHKSIGQKLLHKILRDADLTPEQFLNLLK